MRVIGTAFALWLAAAPASADYHQARDFSRFCFRSGSQDVWQFCLGYIVGVAQVLNNVTDSGGALYGARACLPEELNQGEAVDVVRDYLDANPGMRNHSPDRAIAQAFAEAFACRE